MKNMVILTGAGISAESGIQTFRGSNGLWEGHDIMDVATPEAFVRNPELVLEFYNQRRQQLLQVYPNEAHYNLAALEAEYQVTIVTQNIDNLHERAGSTNVTHLHGELLKVRSSINNTLIYDWKGDLRLGDLAADSAQLRPHIVWFGEEVPLLDHAIEKTKNADLLVIIGTSMQVYPAASLINYVGINTPIYVIDPNPSITKNAFNNLTIIKNVASLGTTRLLKHLKPTI